MKNRPLWITLLGNVTKVTGLAAWQTGRLFQKAAGAALDSIQEVLRAEVKKGNVKLVQDFLANRALPAARSLLIKRMTAQLLVRIGLRGALATSVVGWVLPFVLEIVLRLAERSGVLAKIKANPTVANTLTRLDELKQKTLKALSPDHGSGAEVLEDEEDGAPEQPPRPNNDPDEAAPQFFPHPR